MTRPEANAQSPQIPPRVRARKMRKFYRIALWTMTAPLVLIALLMGGLTIAGWWVERVYLQKEIAIGDDGATLRVHGIHFQWWRLNFHADSVWFRSPALDARAGGADVRIDWIDGISAMRPAARVEADSLWIYLRGDTAVKEPAPLDSVSFPEFSLPLAVSLAVRGLAVEDSAGTMLRIRGIGVRSRGGQSLRARIGRAHTRWTGELEPGASAWLDWSHTDSLTFSVVIRNEYDSVSVSGRHAKVPLWHGHDSLAVMVADAAPYYEAFGIGAGLPGTTPKTDMQDGGIQLNATAALGDSIGVSLSGHAALAAWRVNPDFAVSPQKVELSGGWSRDRGTLVASSQGRDGEDVRLSLTAQIRDMAALTDSTKPLLEHMTASLQGHARGLRVMVRDTLRPADAVIQRARWDGRTFEVALTTGDSSRVEASALLAGPPRARKGTFRIAVMPDERWVRVFAGDVVTFQGLNVQGTYAGAANAGAGRAGEQLVTAKLYARGLESFGFALDSIRSEHEYSLTTGRYVLKRALLHAPAVATTPPRAARTWTLSGILTPAPKGRSKAASGLGVDATLASDGNGSLRYTLSHDGTMEATADKFEATDLPYAPLDSLPLKEGVLHGTFRWSPTRKEGRTDLSARALYTHKSGGANGSARRVQKAEPVSASLKGEWTSRLMTIQEANVSYRGSDLTAHARMRTKGKQFYEIASVAMADYEFAAVETETFNLADILNAFLPEPPLDSGIVRGGLSFSDTKGFAGTLSFERLGVKDAPGELAIRLLRLEGRGDSLMAFARTTSPSAPWLNDSLHATLTGARGEVQTIHVDALVDLRTDGALRLRSDAVMRNFSSLKGTLRAEGSMTISEQAGALKDVKAFIDFDFPSFSNMRERGTLTTHTLSATYINEGQPRQRISLNPTIRNGSFQVPTLRIENDAGQVLSGTLNYAPSEGMFTASVNGERFAAQWTDEYALDVNNLSVDFVQGPQGTRLRGSLSSGTFSFADLPLRVEGRLGAVKAEFVRPPRAAGSERQEWRADTLRVSGVLQSSEMRYRLRNLGDIQRLVRGNGQRRPTVGTPLVLDLKVRTTGNGNRINTDMARLTWVGDLAVRGVHPYTLFDGRISAQSGDFGLEREAYAIRRLDVKWLNSSMEEGEIHMEARKELASSCTQSTQGSANDSCTVITRLDGTLSDLQFSYDSDCGGAYGAGANVAAILYSVQRGCYDGSIAGGESRGYGERALTLLEPTISRGLTQLMGPFWGAWIETAEITGLGSLSPDGTATDSLGEALSLALTSREYRRFRIKVRSGYHLNSQDLSSPMESMLALEWRLPLPSTLQDSAWRRRLNNNLRAAASVETKPVRRGSFETDEIERKIGLFYNYSYWGEWWARKEEVEDNEK